MAGIASLVLTLTCVVFVDVHARPNVVEFAPPPEPQCGYRVGSTSPYLHVFNVLKCISFIARLNSDFNDFIKVLMSIVFLGMD